MHLELIRRFLPCGKKGMSMNFNLKSYFNSASSRVLVSDLAFNLLPANHPIAHKVCNYVYRLSLKYKYVHIILTLKCLMPSFAFKIYLEPFNFRYTVLYMLTPACLESLPHHQSPVLILKPNSDVTSCL